MIELFYFSSLDLMIKVDYHRETNSLRYASHRDMANDERVMAEQFILAKVASKTDYYLKRSSALVYLGTDRRLKKRLAMFQRKSDLHALRREKEIAASVNSLINGSMQRYYTEKIGELILSVRRELRDGGKYESRRANLKQQMNDLLNAYNAYTAHKVTLHEIIPSELKPFWPGLEEKRYSIAPSQ